MRDVPECLHRRYRVLDDLVKELTSSSCRSSDMECDHGPKNDGGIKLLCDFWNILKENPNCNLTEAVQERLGVVKTSIPRFYPQNVTCYLTERENRDCEHSKDAENNECCDGGEQESSPKCCASKSISPSVANDNVPLSKVLCNLKEAVSFDKKCNSRISELMLTQKELRSQIQNLEQREKEGVQLLKQADCMWSCMEEMYKKKVSESLERQKGLLKQLKEIETSATKWRRNKKDLDFQMNNINKCQQDIKEKSNQKTNDIKFMDMEIADYTKRIENNKKDTEASKKSLETKKQASDARISKLAAEVSQQQKVLAEENKRKKSKENEGRTYVKEAREDLRKICTVLLEMKIRNEDLKAEKEALNVEINFLRQTSDNCKDKCRNKQQSIDDEIKAIDKELAEFKLKCIKCHQCTDTIDVRKLCTDCPRCSVDRDCLYEDGHCSPDYSLDCVCMSVKEKFLDNVFENMYTVLEKHTNTKNGKSVSEAVLNCLKRSRNGKLDDETRKILQEFILTTVKKNLNLTIIGGAVKTRCEMDPETYKQLMLCLKQVKAVRPPKEDKGTAVKKESCSRWGGSSECNCPSGPKDCICTKKAPPPPNDPTPCPPSDNENAVETMSCPHKESTACGPDCAMHAVPSRLDSDIASLRPDPCKESSCPFDNTMRTAQCVLGPESICTFPKGFVSPVPYTPDFSNFNNVKICKCGSSATQPCVCKDKRCQPRERIIEEVMGRYIDISPIDKVTVIDEISSSKDNFTSKDVLSHTKRVCACNNSKHNYGSNINKIVRLSSNNDHKLYRNALGDKIKNRKPTIKTLRIYDKSKEIIKQFDSSDFGNKPTSHSTIRTVCSCERKVWDTVQNIIKDMVVPDVKSRNKQNTSNIEWMTVESFVKEITSLTDAPIDNVSEVTTNEIEMKTESLENLKSDDTNFIMTKL